MRNPFEKTPSGSLIAAILFGSIAAGAITYLYLTESGEATRKSIEKKVKAKAKNVAAKAVSKKTGLSKKTVKSLARQVAK